MVDARNYISPRNRGSHHDGGWARPPPKQPCPRKTDTPPPLGQRQQAPSPLDQRQQVPSPLNQRQQAPSPRRFQPIGPRIEPSPRMLHWQARRLKQPSAYEDDRVQHWAKHASAMLQAIDSYNAMQIADGMSSYEKPDQNDDDGDENNNDENTGHGSQPSRREALGERLSPTLLQKRESSRPPLFTPFGRAPSARRP